MKEKNKILIIIAVCAFVVLIGVIALLQFLKYGFVPLKGAKGEKTGYQLIIKTTYGGYGVAGQDLGHGSNYDIYNVKVDDSFADGLFEPIHLYDVDNPNGFDTVILYIQELNDNYVGVIEIDGSHELEYNKEYELKPGYRVSDGVNYTYTIMFIKK